MEVSDLANFSYQLFKQVRPYFRGRIKDDGIPTDFIRQVWVPTHNKPPFREYGEHITIGSTSVGKPSSISFFHFLIYSNNLFFEGSKKEYELPKLTWGVLETMSRQGSVIVNIYEFGSNISKKQYERICKIVKPPLDKAGVPTHQDVMSYAKRLSQQFPQWEGSEAVWAAFAVAVSQIPDPTQKEEYLNNFNFHNNGFRRREMGNQNGAYIATRNGGDNRDWMSMELALLRNNLKGLLERVSMIEDLHHGRFLGNNMTDLPMTRDFSRRVAQESDVEDTQHSELPK